MLEQINELVFLLDKSGSMKPYTAETIDTVNKVIEQQRQRNLKTSISVALFSTDYVVLYDNKEINEVKPLTVNDYHAEGGTALLDALGAVINSIETRYDNMPQKARPTNVNIIVTVLTDGEENSSKLFDTFILREVVKQAKEQYSCKFVLIGADIELGTLAEQLNISIEQTFEVKRSEPNWSNNCFVMMCEAIDDLW